MRITAFPPCFRSRAAAGLLLAFLSLPLPAQTAPSRRQILSRLNRAAARIHSLSAAAVNSTVNSVVGVTDNSTGKLYFLRTRGSPMLELNFDHPAPKEFLFRNGFGWIYQPLIQQAQRYDLRHSRAAFQTFMLVGIADSGTELAQNFRLKIRGDSPLAGRPRVRLDLVPRSAKARRSISQIELWFDPSNWVAVQQKYLQPSGDYRLLSLSQVRINPALSSSIFSTRFPGARKINEKF